MMIKEERAYSGIIMSKKTVKARRISMTSRLRLRWPKMEDRSADAKDSKNTVGSSLVQFC